MHWIVKVILGTVGIGAAVGIGVHTGVKNAERIADGTERIKSKFRRKKEQTE